jgi:hypothetical protein
MSVHDADPGDQILDDALTAYKNAVSQGHRTAMIAALTAADLWAPEWLEPVLAAYNEDIPGASTHRARLRKALGTARDQCEAAGRVGELRDRGMPVSYGLIPLRPQPWKQQQSPGVCLYPSGTIEVGSLQLNRDGAAELIRLLQLALRDQAALLAGSV